jgi:hypothetical protein
MPRVAVIGATGQIGRPLCRELISAEYGVTVVSRDPDRAAGEVAGAAAYVAWDPASPGYAESGDAPVDESSPVGTDWWGRDSESIERAALAAAHTGCGPLCCAPATCRLSGASPTRSRRSRRTSAAGSAACARTDDPDGPRRDHRYPHPREARRPRQSACGGLRVPFSKLEAALHDSAGRDLTQGGARR